MDLEENRNLQTGQLYKNERKLLAGPPYSDDLNARHRKKARRKIIDTRLPNLPQRIQALVDDVALLNAGGFLNQEYWSDGWEQLVGLNPPVGFQRKSNFVADHTWMPNTTFDGEVRLGYTMGQMLGSLFPRSGDHLNKFNDLCWGFLLGFLGEPQSGFQAEYTKISSVLDHASEKMDKKLQRTKDIDSIMEMKSLNKNLSEDKTVENFSLIPDRENTLDSGVSGIDSLISRILKDTFPASLEEVRSVGELTLQVQQTISLINDSQSGHLSAKEVFRESWDMNSELIDRDSIKQKCDASKKQVTQIMNNFGDKPSSEKWQNEILLVDEKGNGRVNREWSLTNFGYVVGFVMFEENGVELTHRAIGQVLAHQEEKSELHKNIKKCMLNFSETESSEWQMNQ